MLIEKSITTGDVVSLKLTSGEELIARYEGEDDLTIKLDKPLQLVAGGKSLGMMPWFFLGSTDIVKVNKMAIAAGPVLSKKDAAAQYLEGTTGIALS